VVTFLLETVNRPEATASLSFPDIHPWACNLSCWQSACD